MSFTPPHFAVWVEIPVTDLDAAMKFYSDVFSIEMQKVENEAPNPFALFPIGPDDSVSGHLYPGKPAADGSGPTVHLACPDTLAETGARIEAGGGKVLSPEIPLPVGAFIYCQDPDGNSIGVFKRPEG